VEFHNARTAPTIGQYASRYADLNGEDIVDELFEEKRVFKKWVLEEEQERERSNFERQQHY